MSGETARRSTVIVTRPKGDAAPLIEMLRDRGHEVVAFPVLGIEPVDDAQALAAAMARIDRYRLVVFVSPNAIRHAVALRTQAWPHAVAVAAMGPGSVAALDALGIASPAIRVVSPADSPVEQVMSADAGSDAGADAAPSLRRYDSEALLAALDATLGLRRGFEGRVLIVRGNGGRAWFADRLRERGIAVDEVESYRRVRPEPDAASAAALRRLYRDDAPAIFIVTSSEGLSNLVAMLEVLLASEGHEVAQARQWLLKQRIVAPHARIAEKARRAGFCDVSLAESGDSGIAAAIE